ncbi:MAG: hypothetical protein U9Q63_03225, partial [Patescibacteria group bacterium]|nr:hypothetical protein [Patescibacteria group bacterium]
RLISDLASSLGIKDKDIGNYNLKQLVAMQVEQKFIEEVLPEISFSNITFKKVTIKVDGRKVILPRNSKKKPWVELSIGVRHKSIEDKSDRNKVFARVTGSRKQGYQVEYFLGGEKSRRIKVVELETTREVKTRQAVRWTFRGTSLLTVFSLLPKVLPIILSAYIGSINIDTPTLEIQPPPVIVEQVQEVKEVGEIEIDTVVKEIEEVVVDKQEEETQKEEVVEQPVVQTEIERVAYILEEIVNKFQEIGPEELGYEDSGIGFASYIKVQLTAKGEGEFLETIINNGVLLTQIQAKYLMFGEGQELQCVAYAMALGSIDGTMEIFGDINQAQEIIRDQVKSGDIRSMSFGGYIARMIGSAEELEEGDLVVLYKNAANHVFKVIKIESNEEGQVQRILVTGANRLKNADGSITEDGKIRTRWLTPEEFEEEFDVSFKDGVAVARSYDADEVAQARLREQYKRKKQREVSNLEVGGNGSEDLVQYEIDTRCPYSGTPEVEISENGLIFPTREWHLDIPEQFLPTYDIRDIVDLIDWLNLDDPENMRYQAEEIGDGLRTFCNIFVKDFTRISNVPIPGNALQYNFETGEYEMRQTSANWMYNWLTGDGEKLSNVWINGSGADFGWQEISADEAPRQAEVGSVVVAVAYNPNGHGHTAIVRPGGRTINGVYYPQVANVGDIVSSNISAYITFEDLIKNDIEIKYFVNSGAYEFIVEDQQEISFLNTFKGLLGAVATNSKQWW